MVGQTLSIIALAAGVAAVPPADKQSEEGFVSIFNGKDLTGWEGKPGAWTIQDGAITAQSTPEKPCRRHTYLMWRGGKPGDFELKLSYRIVGGNSGIQFRSRELKDFDIEGYQADLEAGEQWSGALFEVGGRGGMAMRGQRTVFEQDGTKRTIPLADSKELLKHIKPEDWNEYHIIARGPEITLKINGVVMSQVVDHAGQKAARSGVIALQMHPGPPMKVQFKNIRLKSLD